MWLMYMMQKTLIDAAVLHKTLNCSSHIPTDVGAYCCNSICVVAHYYNQHGAAIVKLF